MQQNYIGYIIQCHRLFSSQQYFDDKGMFISLLLSTPVLINCFVIVVRTAQHFVRFDNEVSRKFVKHIRRSLKSLDNVIR